MKGWIYIQVFMAALLLSGCSGAQYFVKQGNNPQAIYAAANKLRKNPKKADKTILALEHAWKVEQTRILDRINFLKLDGNPESWVEINDLYNQLDGYQRTVKPFLPLFIHKEYRNADIPLVDVQQELVNSKQKAAEFLYAKGNQLLDKNDKMAARDAYGYFVKIKDYYGNYKDVDDKINEAYNSGQNHILVGYSNHTNMIIPQQFMDNLTAFNEQELNSPWTKYHTNQNDRSAYDYLLEVHVLTIDIGPEQVNNTSYQDKKQVQDGFQYILDGKGNVMKDSLGNDMKEPAYKDIVATIFRTEQTKIGVLNGVVEYKRANGQVFQKFPFQEALGFKNMFATFQGDKNALSAESKKIIGGAFVPFPSNIQMVMDASELVKAKTYAIIQNNQGLVVN
ncbi:MAG: hypothetical protein LRY27_00640 [Chitinophagales bacterium]|nr:hypothetical protein [Chitinophagales bacterium]